MSAIERTAQITDLSFLHETGRTGPALTLVTGDRSAAAVRSAPAEVSPVAEVLRREGTYRRLLISADAVAAIGTLGVAALATGKGLSGLFFLPALLAVFFAKVQGLYDRDDVVIQKSTVTEWRALFQSAALTAVGVYLGWRILTAADKGGGVRLLVGLTFAMFFFDVLGRVIARWVARAVTPHERIVIVGDPKRCLQLAQNLGDVPGVDFLGTIPGDSLGSSAQELKAVVDHLHTHRLVIAPDHNQPETVTLDLIRSAKAMGVRVTLMPTIMAVVGGRAAFDEVHGLMLLGVPRFGLSDSSAALKRVFDVLSASVAAFVSIPLFLALAAAIKLDSPGPVLFRQTRVGRDGRHFKILKLRTMVDGAESLKTQLVARNEASDGLFKMADDPRVTRVGRYLRALHLDELPQFINVLKGDMSLVGPRPLVVEEDAKLLMSGQRLPLTPGITGPWQIRGPMNASLTEMARLDYLYISSWSVWRDVDILIRTVQKMLSRGGV